MFNLFSKERLSILCALLALSTSLLADECCDSSACNRLYIGGFGGGLYSDSTRVSQMGTAYFLEAQGGPLAVNARGSTKKTSSGFGGVQIGYEWSRCPFYIGCSGWSISPALELEGYWYKHKKKGHLTNPTTRLDEHDFLDSFHLNTGVYLANAVFALNNPCWCRFTPYVGLGVGAARISANKAKSIQTDPPERGVNHFNSKRNDSDWTFAAQVKAGIRYNVCQSLHFFGEYRYLFIDSSNYIFGSTVYPNHAATSPWNVKVRNLQYNAFAFGIQYDL